jgi:AraC-like DNA-binding protein
VTGAASTLRLLRVKDLIDARYAEPLDGDALARVAGLSSARFSRRFHQAFGESPHQYLISRRMERAAALLRSTDYPVPGSFTTSFGRAYRLSPTAYRASHQPDVAGAAIPSCELRRWSRPVPGLAAGRLQ